MSEIPSNCKLFVGSLPPTCTQEQLHSLMCTVGSVQHVHMMNRPTPTGSICAFVEFATPEAAQAAIDTFDNKVTLPPHSIPMTCSVAQPKGATRPVAAGGSMLEPKVFVGNLPATIQDSDLREAFSPYGTVAKVVMISKTSPTGNRSAFILYEEMSSCQSAISALNNNHMFPGGTSNIVVRFADSAQGKGPSQPSASPYGAAPNSNQLKLFVGNLPQECSQQTLQDIMSTYGQITHIHMMTNPTATGAICAFVEYATIEQASAAIQALNGVYTIPPRDGPMTVQYAKSKGPAAAVAPAAQYSYHQYYQQYYPGYYPAYPPYGAYPPPGRPGGPYAASGYPGYPSGDPNAAAEATEFKLFVGNLPLSMTQETLRDMFVPFGNMIEAFLFKKGTETAKGAFVRYSDNNSAQQAIATLHGSDVEGQKIVVQYARSKEPTEYAPPAVPPVADPYAGYGYPPPGSYPGYGGYGAPDPYAAAAAAAAGGPQGAAPQSPVPGTSAPDTTITVTNIPPNYDTNSVNTMFATFGTIRSLQVYNDDSSQEASGALKAVIGFDSASEAQTAQQAMNNFQMGGGYKLRVTVKSGSTYRPY